MEAIVLKKIPTREYDELVVCYTREAGKQTYIAKSILRESSKQKSHLDLLNLVDFSLVQKNAVSVHSLGGGGAMPIITSAYSLAGFSGLKNSMQGIALGHLILEVFDKFVMENECDESLWQFLNKNLYELDEKAKTLNVDWKEEFKQLHDNILGVLGYGHGVELEWVLQRRLNSLTFVKYLLQPTPF